MEDRKDWLRAFKPGTHADYNVESVTYENFVNKELILFSVSRLTRRMYQVSLLDGNYFFFVSYASHAVRYSCPF